MDELDDADDTKASAVQLILELTAAGAVSAPAAGGGGAASPAAAAPVAAAPAFVASDKFFSGDKSIKMGQPQDATHGLPTLMGVGDTEIATFLLQGEGAIEREFVTHGSPKDQENFAKIVGGSYVDSSGACKTMEELMVHPHAVMAKLRRPHVLALRLYTTDSYRRINDPLRQEPPQRPHPFAATTYFISEGIKLLRAVAASLPDAHTTVTYWRGMKDLGLTMEFMQKGGTEFACMSTSASQEIAVTFAASACPLIFKFQTQVRADRSTRSHLCPRP
jgi:hypothetical protein